MSFQTLFMNHFLSIILFEPLVGALLLLLVNKQNENAIKWIANITTFIGFAISIPLWFWFNPQSGDFQFVERAPWIPSIGAEYFLGVDGLSMLLILLTTMMGFIAVLSSWTGITERIHWSRTLSMSAIIPCALSTWLSRCFRMRAT